MNRKAKILWTENEKARKLIISKQMSEQEEAQFVAGKIKELVDSGKRKLSVILPFYIVQMHNRG